jgi:hypothetical protein
MSFFASTSDKIIYGSIATFSLAIWYKFLFTYLKTHNAQAWASALVIIPLLAIGLCSIASARLKYFFQFSALSHDAVNSLDKTIYSIFIHCLGIIFNFPAIIGLLKYSVKWSAAFGISVISFSYAIGIFIYFISRALYRKSIKMFYSIIVLSPFSVDRLVKLKSRNFRLSVILFVKQVPFATSIKQALGFILIGLVLAVSGVMYAATFQNDTITASVTMLISALLLFILSRVDYQLLRFAARVGYSPVETILAHLGAGLLFSGFFSIALLIALGGNFNYIIGISLGCWFLSVLILAVYICTLRLHSKKLGTFIFQGHFILIGISFSLYPALGLLCLFVLWSRTFRAAHKRQWLLP